MRFLQERRFRPLGSETTEDADVRIIAATNAELGVLISSGSFRQDLLFRLDVAPLLVPALRERGPDVLLLAHHFLARFAREYGITPPNSNAGG